jgi:hypothetical protein
MAEFPSSVDVAVVVKVGVWVYVVVAYSATVHFVWLFFADTAFAWVPYQFYPWVLFWK